MLPCSLAALVCALIPQASAHEEAVVFEGLVYEPLGRPAEGAVVLSSAGGQAVTDGTGAFRLEARLPRGAESVELTVVGQGTPSMVARQCVGFTRAGVVRVGPLWLAPTSACQPSWLPTFGGRPGLDERIHALAVYDDGSGPALHAGGLFTSAGGVAANRIARWDGRSWNALGSGMNDGVSALAVYDDGGGPALYAGGSFTLAGGVAAHRIARWDGSSWSALGSGLSDAVYALAVHDDGGGPALFAGGSFTAAGGTVARLVAKWNGASWARLRGGLNGSFVLALAVYDDGSGPALHAGGNFTSIVAGPSASGVAKWDGSLWSALGSGVSGAPFLGVAALSVFDDGHGPALFAGGDFTTAGGSPASRIARWNGSSWAALGGGVDSGYVGDLLVHDDGGGPALVAAGNFTSAGGVATSRIARWNGSSWAALGTGIDGNSVSALADFDPGDGPALFVGGDFSGAGGELAPRLARWDGTRWQSAECFSGLDEHVLALTVHDDGSGSALYAGGAFTSANGVALSRIGRWNGSSWSALGSGMAGGPFPSVGALTVFDDGSGPVLCAGGDFASAGGVAAGRIAKWDGANWSALGGGMNATVLALTVFDDGSGPALFAGGAFTTADGLAASRIATWNGSSWKALGSGLNGPVWALAELDDGSGPALYVGGAFTTAGGVPANRIARWDGSSWTALGSGLNGTVRTLVAFDEGGLPRLHVGGDFTSAGGVSANRIARWSGSSWSALSNGMNGSVDALAVFDVGAGLELFAGGGFTTAGGVAARGLARWRSFGWSASSGGVDDWVHALTVFDDGGGPALHVGGSFGSAIDSHDSFLARWGCGVDLVPPRLCCPEPVFVLDSFSSPFGETVHFSVTAADNVDPSPSVLCTPPSGSFFPLGTTLVICTATDDAGNQSTCEFPVTVQVKARRR